ncbi:MAG: hypothetical protein CMP38_00575 [Rickettsiales bacterium]|nr:hypothetical protein [Rickettsiales bacterium]
MNKNKQIVNKGTIDYRPEIDGLRAIAVISVIVYHLQINVFDFTVMSGGFLGVDIFFVISGYLITSIILKELNSTSGFSFLNFYERRARRILPILLVVMISTFVIGWFILFPAAYLDLAYSILYTLGFSSNFYFFISETQYQAVSSLFKPFIHTWSLAIEEQYYFIFPFVLVFLYNFLKKHIIKLLILAILINILLIHFSGNLNLSPPFFEKNFSFFAPAFIFDFYFLTSRFWELLFGSCLAYIEVKKINKNKNNTNHTLISIIGLAFIIFSLFFYNDKIFHPSVFTLLPVIGVSIIIYFTANNENFIKKLLSQRIFVGIGLISYSLYLWHYPIFAFGRINQNYDITVIHKVIWIAMTVILSVISYFYIERPFRNRNIINKNFLLKSILLASLLIIISNIVIIKNNGFKTRFDHLSKIYGTIEFDNDYLGEESWKYLQEFNAFKENKKVKILIVGDSHSKDIFNCFHQNTHLFPEYQFRRLGYDNNTRLRINTFIPGGKEEERKLMTKLLSSNPNFLQSEVVVISSRYSQNEVDALPNFINYLKEFDKHIILLSRTNEYEILKAPTRTQVDIKLLEIFKNRNEFDLEKRKNLEKIMYDKRILNKYENINNQLSKISEKYEIKYLKKQDFLCNEQSKLCDALTPDGNKIFFDNDHYTLKGAKYLGEKIYNMKWFNIE